MGASADNPLAELNPNRYVPDVARTQKLLLPVDEVIARHLREGVERAGLSYRSLASDTGMSLNRIGIILRQETPPATGGELSRIASAIGLSASEVMARAEAELAGRPERTNLAD